jgi:hypothetical protein
VYQADQTVAHAYDKPDSIAVTATVCGKSMMLEAECGPLQARQHSRLSLKTAHSIAAVHQIMTHSMFSEQQ